LINAPKLHLNISLATANRGTFGTHNLFIHTFTLWPPQASVQSGG